MSDPTQLGVLGAAALLRSRRVSAVELADLYFEQIERRNGGPPSQDGDPGAINAWIRLYPEHARERARAADERLAREGDATPLLCGFRLR